MRIRYVSEAVALTLAPDGRAALISITEPGRQAPLPSPHLWGALLRIQFADAEYDADMLNRLAARGKPLNPEAKGFPCRSNAEAIREFLGQLKGRQGVEELVVHCHAGKRRSGAVAKFASEFYGIENSDTFEDHNRTVYALLNQPSIFEGADHSSWFSRLVRRLRNV